MKQRELKFRVWDTRTKKMLTGFHLFGEVTLIGGIHAWQDEELHGVNSPAESDSLERLNDLVEMQFTGLKDKEGNEIFEGDILEATRQVHEKQPLREGNKYSKVVFEDGAFMASQMVQLNSKKIYTHGYKVVGDVYSAPHLLESPNTEPS